MTALLTFDGTYDRRAIMRKAHAEFRASKRRGVGRAFSRAIIRLTHSIEIYR